MKQLCHSSLCLSPNEPFNYLGACVLVLCYSITNILINCSCHLAAVSKFGKGLYCPGSFEEDVILGNNKCSFIYYAVRNSEWVCCWEWITIIGSDSDFHSFVCYGNSEMKAKCVLVYSSSLMASNVLYIQD